MIYSVIYVNHHAKTAKKYIYYDFHTIAWDTGIRGLSTDFSILSQSYSEPLMSKDIVELD